MKKDQFILNNYEDSEIFKEFIAGSIADYTKESRANVFYNHNKTMDDIRSIPNTVNVEISINKQGHEISLDYLASGKTFSFSLDNSKFNHLTFNTKQSLHNKYIINAYNDFLYYQKKQSSIVNELLEIKKTSLGGSAYDNERNISFVIRKHPIGDIDYSELKSAHYEKFATFNDESSNQIWHILINKIDLQAWIDDPGTKKKFGANYGANYDTSLDSIKRKITKEFLNKS